MSPTWSCAGANDSGNTAAVKAGRDGRQVIIMGYFKEWLLPGRLVRRLHPELPDPWAAKTFPSRLPLIVLDQMFCYTKNLLQDLRGITTPHRLGSPAPRCETCAGQANR